MSVAKIMKCTQAISDVAAEVGVSDSQKLATLRAIERHVQSLIRKIEGDKPAQPARGS